MRVHMLKNRNGSLCYIVINKIANTQIETINDDNNTAMGNTYYIKYQYETRAYNITHLFFSCLFCKRLEYDAQTRKYLFKCFSIRSVFTFFSQQIGRCRCFSQHFNFNSLFICNLLNTFRGYVK